MWNVNSTDSISSFDIQEIAKKGIAKNEINEGVISIYNFEFNLFLIVFEILFLLKQIIKTNTMKWCKF